MKTPPLRTVAPATLGPLKTANGCPAGAVPSASRPQCAAVRTSVGERATPVHAWRGALICPTKTTGVSPPLEGVPPTIACAPGANASMDAAMTEAMTSRRDAMRTPCPYPGEAAITLPGDKDREKIPRSRVRSSLAAAGARRTHKYHRAVPTAVVTGGAGFLGSHLCDLL